MSAGRPRVVLLRGHGVTPWELRPWELLAGEFDVVCLVTGRNRFEPESLALRVERVRTIRDLLPRGRAGDLAVLGPGDRYLDLEQHLAGAALVHSLELGNPWSGQPAALRRELGFRLVLTVWETIPLLDTYRRSRGRAYRRDAIRETDLFLATTERARDALVLEGVERDRIEISPPGIDVERFSAHERRPEVVLSIGRLVWEKGHQDVLRALAAIRRGVVPGEAPRLLVVGSGPEQGRLRRHARDLGVDDLLEIAALSYEQMPGAYARASALVLASLPTPLWEEQFGMVLAEAMASGVPVVAAAAGAIPQVLRGSGTLFPPGDWVELARALTRERLPVAPPDLVAEYSTAAAAERLARAYRRVLAG
jgi:glycosyltransferase involved in cell wall biosynthesis